MRLKSLKWFLLFLSSFTIIKKILSYTLLTHQYMLQGNDVASTPCTLLTSSPSPTSGSTIFSQVGLHPLITLQQLTITGWYILKGFNSQMYYTLLSIHEGSQSIFALSYNLANLEMKVDLKSSSQTNVVSFLTNFEWIYIQIQVNLAPLAVSTDNASIFIQQGSTQQYSFSLSHANLLGEVMNFSRLISINKGYSSFLIGYNPACSQFKYVVLYLDLQPASDLLATPTTLSHSKMALDTYLLWHFDLYNSLSLPNYLFSSGRDQDIVSMATLKSTFPWEFDDANALLTKITDFTDNNGFIFSFELKINSLSVNRYIFSLSNDLIYQFSLISNSGLTIDLQGVPLLTTFHSVDPNYWYKAVFIVTYSDKTDIQYFLQTDTILFKKTFSFSYPFRQVYLWFAQLGVLVPFKLDNIRIYSGTFVAEDASCLMYTARKEYNCLICQPGYDLSYQNGMSCIQQATPKLNTVKQNIQDWPRTPCPKYQMYADSDTCVCIFGSYLDLNNLCMGCPSYCKGCTGPHTCIEKDPLRDQLTGLCPDAYFDDGYLCLSRKFMIPLRENIVRTLPPIGSDLLATYQLQSRDFQQNTIESYFLGFFIESIDSNDINVEYLLAYVQQGDQYVFSFSLKKNIPQQYYICLYHYLNVMKCFNVKNEPIWIGFWSRLSEIIIAISNAEQTFYETEQLPQILLPFLSVVCVGFCKQDSQGLGFPIFLGQISLNSPFSFIQGMTNPLENMTNFFLLQQKPSEMLLFFNSMNSQKSSTTGICYNTAGYSSTIGYNLNIQQVKLIKPLKGIQNVSGVSASIAQTINGSKAFSVSMNLYMEIRGYQLEVISFKLSSVPLVISLGCNIAIQTCHVKICLPLNCQKTTYALVYYQNPSFLAIILHNSNLESSQSFVYEFEIVCNYKRETLKFMLDYHLNLSAINSIEIPYLEIWAKNTYVNNLRFFQGSDFYFDYSLNDHCFIYYDLANMKCLKAKQGYAVFDSVAIPSSQCSYQTSPQGTLIMYNKYTSECFDTRVNNPLCDELDEDLISCVACKDSNADPSNNCQCKDGFYLPSNSMTCVACHPKCSKCNIFEACTECYFPETRVPDCQCDKSDQYLDSSYQCQNCSPQCDECQGNRDDCTVCSEGRINPPKCDCNPQFYDLSLSNKSVCVPYSCSIECETCEYSSFDCTSCSAGRTDPPDCICQTNYYESTLKECLACPSHYYYSSVKRICLPCDPHCKQCSESSLHCTDCYDDLFLIDSACLCSDQSNYILSTAGEVICSVISMNVSLSVIIENSSYCLVFSFDDILTSVDFNETPIDTILFIYIQQVPSENYSITYTEIVGNQLKVFLQFQHSFVATSGTVTFITILYLKGASTSRLLDSSYLSKALPFKIGPVLFSETEWQMNTSLDSIANSLKNMDSTVISLVRQFSIVFYVLNTLQPTVLFLMTKIAIPPNLYQTLSIAALMIFPNVEGYSMSNESVPTSFFGYPLEKDQDISVNSQQVFKRFSQSNCMLVNIPILLIQCIIQYLLFAGITIYKTLSLSPKCMNLVQKLNAFLLKNINSNTETSLLLISTAIFNQYLNTDYHQYFNRYSLYLSFIFTTGLIYFNTRAFYHISTVTINSLETTTKSSSVYLELLNKLKFQSNPKLSKYYYFSQLLKKYIVAFLIVFSHDHPSILCTGCSFIFFCSMVATAYFRPYKSGLDNGIKIIGEACLLTVWMIYLFKFIPFLDTFSKVITIPTDQVRQFINFGTAAIAILAIYNALYLVEFLWKNLILNMYNLIKKPPQQDNKPSEESIKNEKQLHFLSYHYRYVKQQQIIIAKENLQKQGTVIINSSGI